LRKFDVDVSHETDERVERSGVSCDILGTALDESDSFYTLDVARIRRFPLLYQTFKRFRMLFDVSDSRAIFAETWTLVKESLGRLFARFNL